MASYPYLLMPSTLGGTSKFSAYGIHQAGGAGATYNLTKSYSVYMERTFDEVTLYYNNNFYYSSRIDETTALNTTMGTAVRIYADFTLDEDIELTNYLKTTTKVYWSDALNSELQIECTQYSGFLDITFHSDSGSYYIILNGSALPDDIKSQIASKQSLRFFLVTGAEAAITKYTLTENLTNITSDNTKTEFEENTEHTITYTASGDNEITSLTSNIGAVEIASNKKSATLTFTATENITVTGVAGLPTFTITEDLTNIESYGINPKTIEYGTSFVLQYSSSGDYKIKTLTSTIGTVTISSDEQYATIAGTATENIVVTGVAVAEYNITISGTIENATCNYTSGDVISADVPPIITANEGFEFTGVYTYVHGNLTSQATKSDDNTILTFSNVDGNIDLNDSYVATQKIEKLSTFVNLYTVTNDELTALSKVRFLDDTDYGQYILGLYILPFIDLDLVTYQKTPIILGTYDSGIEATQITSNTVSVSLPQIDIPEKYGNVYDYLNTECVLRTPFYEDIPLNPEYVIGHTIVPFYRIDLYTGACRLNVVSSATDNVIYTSSSSICLNIPFIQKSSGSVINSLSQSPYTQVLTPIVEVKRNIPYNADSLQGHKIAYYTDESTIREFLTTQKANYFEIESCNLQDIPTIEELNELLNLLQTGVYYADPNTN